MNDVESSVERFFRFIEQREKLDVEQVYAQLRGSYPLAITSYLENGYKMKVLSGESALGTFELFDNGVDIIFEMNGGYHWHPANAEEAIAGVDAFMQGVIDEFTESKTDHQK